ncbi:hypothetical protein [Deinococcus irradiatisoli]|uniref:hypothetical protein n=1 Tax=Deinococcus irradiatisoli TaxID=2202254 RepID=UPI003CCC74BB
MLDDFERPTQMQFDVLRELSSVPRIGLQVLHARKDLRQISQEEDRACAVLDMRLMHLDGHNESQRIDEEMPFAPVDLFAHVVATGPPASVLLTD